MKCSILTLFPDLYTSFLQTSLVDRAQKNGLVDIKRHNLFDFCAPSQRVDAPTAGPGTGMVIRPEVIDQAVVQAQEWGGPALKIFFSPQGKKLTQPLLRSLIQRIKQHGHVMFVAARYEGMDERVHEYYADQVISIGDYVLMGGDLPTMVCLEGLLRLIPGVVSKAESVEHESFSSCFVDYPVYALPVLWHDLEIPEVIRSGDHAKIDQWRQDHAIQKSVLTHFDWVRSCVTRDEDIARARAYIPKHYVALLHDDIMQADGSVGTTSVTTLDIHDIARSCATYGVLQYGIITPLEDQQKIVNKLLDFWKTDVAIEYNPKRHEALSRVVVARSLDAFIQDIERQERIRPFIIATSAQAREGFPIIHFAQQDDVWRQGRPILIIFGTGQGIASKTLEKADGIFQSIRGFSAYNHLSVRSAVGIILDRWLGINNTMAGE